MCPWVISKYFGDDIIFGSTNQEICKVFGDMMAHEF
jgi:hypothetical protein